VNQEDVMADLFDLLCKELKEKHGEDALGDDLFLLCTSLSSKERACIELRKTIDELDDIVKRKRGPHEEYVAKCMVKHRALGEGEAVVLVRAAQSLRHLAFAVETHDVSASEIASVAGCKLAACKDVCFEQVGKMRELEARVSMLEAKLKALGVEPNDVSPT
jgi:hypothetical protein